MTGSNFFLNPKRFLRVLEYAKVVGKDYGFACKDIGIDTGWDRLSLD
jgi:hypothetical protein